MRIKKSVIKRRERRNSRYQLARSLGFPAIRAIVMMCWSEKRIRAAVADKAAVNMNNG